VIKINQNGLPEFSVGHHPKFGSNWSVSLSPVMCRCVEFKVCTYKTKKARYASANL